MMDREAREWQARVAERNKMEVAKARFHQTEFRWSLANEDNAGPQAPADGLTQEQRDLRDSPLGMTLGLYWNVPADCEPAGVPANRPEGGPRSVAADGKEVA